MKALKTSRKTDKGARAFSGRTLEEDIARGLKSKNSFIACIAEELQADKERKIENEGLREILSILLYKSPL